MDFDDRSLSSVTGLYTSDAVVEWVGNTHGLGGTYNGKTSIGNLYTSTLGECSAFDIVFTSVQTIPDSLTITSTTSVALINGSSNVVGAFNASVNISTAWVLAQPESGSIWEIQEDTWNFTTFNVANPSEATVFPQWGLSLSGHDPNLAQMHETEWTYAPYVAGALYAGLAGSTLTAATLMVRSRRRRRDFGRLVRPA